jgi:hypothetical protein
MIFFPKHLLYALLSDNANESLNYPFRTCVFSCDVIHTLPQCQDRRARVGAKRGPVEIEHSLPDRISSTAKIIRTFLLLAVLFCMTITYVLYDNICIP